MKPRAWWAPRRATWWIGVLFAVGSACFAVAPFPGFVELVGSAVDGLVFFVGSIFFTSAATLQFLEAGPSEPRRLDWWSSAVQLLGTVFFNISTFRALQSGLDTTEYNRLVWRPDALGSICFLVSGYLAYFEVCGRVLCRPGATLGLPELGLGLIPGAGGTVSITRRIGRWRTAYLVLSGRTIDSATALRWGLVDEVQ